jgi:hypothetical protein
MSNTGWDRSLGTSKREQGIITPKQPHRRKCGCWFRGAEIYQLCNDHQLAIELARKRAEEMAAQPTQPQPKPQSAPWTENVNTTEAVSVGIITPGESNEKDQANIQ